MLPGEEVVITTTRVSSQTDAVPHSNLTREEIERDHGVEDAPMLLAKQPGAYAYSDAGKQQVRELIRFYQENAKLIREGLTRIGMKTYGGVNAPYVWVKTPAKLTSWETFDLLLNKAQVVCTPGAGFGKCGEGHVRISAFNSRENVETALARIAAALK